MRSPRAWRSRPPRWSGLLAAVVVAAVAAAAVTGPAAPATPRAADETAASSTTNRRSDRVPSMTAARVGSLTLGEGHLAFAQGPEAVRHSTGGPSQDRAPWTRMIRDE